MRAKKVINTALTAAILYRYKQIRVVTFLQLITLEEVRGCLQLQLYISSGTEMDTGKLFRFHIDLVYVSMSVKVS